MGPQMAIIADPLRVAAHERWVSDGNETRSASREYLPIPGDPREPSTEGRQTRSQSKSSTCWPPGAAQSGREEPASCCRRLALALLSVVTLAGLVGLTTLAAMEPHRADLLATAVASLLLGMALSRLWQSSPPLVTPKKAVTAVGATPSVTGQSSNKERMSAEDQLKELQGQGKDEQGVLDQYIKPDTEELDGARTGRLSTGFLRSQTTIVAPKLEAHALLDDFGWDLDVCAFAGSAQVEGRPIYVLGTYLIKHEGVMVGIPDWMLRPGITTSGTSAGELERRVQRFLLELDRGYGSVPYHNSTHACDVMKNMHLFFHTEMLESLLEIREWTRLVSVLAAALHDLAHPGLTNNFHIVTRSELALRYNDKSPLEQMHVSSAFQLMANKPATDWYGAFHKEVYIESAGKNMKVQSRFRRVLIAMVLGTDPLVHNEHVEKLRDFLDKPEEEREVLLGSSSEWQSFFLELALHASDIANPSYEWHTMMKWTRRLFDEFWAQGDKEKELLGSAMIPMFDRDNINIAAAQSGFINFIALGLWEPVASLVPEMESKVARMRKNLAIWEARKAKGLKAMPSPEEVLPDEVR